MKRCSTWRRAKGCSCLVFSRLEHLANRHHRQESETLSRLLGLEKGRLLFLQNSMAMNRNMYLCALLQTLNGLTQIELPFIVDGDAIFILSFTKTFHLFRFKLISWRHTTHYFAIETFDGCCGISRRTPTIAGKTIECISRTQLTFCALSLRSVEFISQLDSIVSQFPICHDWIDADAIAFVRMLQHVLSFTTTDWDVTNELRRHVRCALETENANFECLISTERYCRCCLTFTHIT